MLTAKQAYYLNAMQIPSWRERGASPPAYWVVQQGGLLLIAKSTDTLAERRLFLAIASAIGLADFTAELNCAGDPDLSGVQLVIGLGELPLPAAVNSIQAPSLATLLADAQAKHLFWQSLLENQQVVVASCA